MIKYETVQNSIITGNQEGAEKVFIDCVLGDSKKYLHLVQFPNPHRSWLEDTTTSQCCSIESCLHVEHSLQKQQRVKLSPKVERSKV